MEPGAVLCIECGYHLDRGRRLKTKSNRPTQTFGSSPVTPLRKQIALGCGGAGLFICLVGILVCFLFESGFLVGLPVLGVGSLLILPVTILGNGQRMTITKSKKGEPLLIQEEWICFLSVRASTTSLRKWDAVFFDCSVSSDGEQADVYSLRLGRRDRSQFLLLYRGTDEHHMKYLGELLQEVAGLSMERM
jgi:hypothetical protein